MQERLEKTPTLWLKDVDWFYSKTTKYDDVIQKTIYDGLWLLLENEDDFLYNKWTIKEAEKLTSKDLKINDFLIKRWNFIQKKMSDIADVLLWVDFKKPANNIKIYQWNTTNSFDVLPIKIPEDYYDNFNLDNPYENYNLNPNKNIDLCLKKWDQWYYDNFIIEDPLKIFEKSNSVALAWAVWDCAGINSFYKKGEKQIIWITHAWYHGLKNKVVEQLIDAYKSIIWREEIKKVIFDISPLAGINYEFEEKVLLSLFKEQFKNYDIDHIQDGIFIPYEQDKEKWFFMIWKLLERIFLENGIEKNQLNFHQDYTTSFDNKWPSYRLHTLSKNWIIDIDIPNSRMWVFNIIMRNLKKN